MYVAFKPMLTHASCVFDIAARFSEIGESFFTRFVVTEDVFVTSKQLRYILAQLLMTLTLMISGQQIRLQGGNQEREGRLEVYYNGVWGTVCDDFFDNVDASVACFQLGFG